MRRRHPSKVLISVLWWGKLKFYIQRVMFKYGSYTVKLRGPAQETIPFFLQFSHLENGIKLLILKNHCDLESFYKGPDMVYYCLVYPQYATKLVDFLCPFSCGLGPQLKCLRKRVLG